MMKSTCIRLGRVLLLTGMMYCIPGPQISFALQQEDYTGTYTMTAGGTTLTLIFKESQGILTGTLSSSTGAGFKLEGTITEGAAAGVCSSQQGSVYFEAFLAGRDLTLSLIEPDAQNMPDYDNARYLAFTKQSSVTGNQAMPPPVAAQPFNQQNQNFQNPGNPNTSNPVVATSPAEGRPRPSGNQIGDKSWGFTFSPPEGWTHQQAEGVMLLGHNTIPGLIVVMPHNAKMQQELETEMRKGIQEEGVYLMLSGALNQLSGNSIIGDYSGTWDGSQVRAKGIGTLSPYGGGAFIIAVSTPDQLGKGIIAAAKTIEQNMYYAKVDVSGLMQQFSGKWTSFTTNTTTWMYLYPNGIYSEQYESSYAGNFANDVGDITGNWGAYSQSDDRGKWTIRGNRDAGRIIVRLANGEELVFDYKVHSENGQTYYNEYWFNGSLYSKSAIQE